MTQPSPIRLMTESVFQSKSAEQDGRLDNYGTRVEAIETLGGLAPGDVSDATVMSLVANSETGTAAQVRATVAANLPSTTAPTPSSGDDTNALNALLAANAGKTLILKAGRTYKISDALNLASGTTLDLNGATIDATAIPDGAAMRQRFAFKASGYMGESVLIGTALSKWSRTITGITSTATLAAGDLIRIRNFENPGPGGTKTNIDKGELNIIASVNSGTQITLAYGTLFDYANDGSLVIAKMTPVENITVKNGRVIMGGILSAHTGLSFSFARNINVIDVEVDGAEDTGVHFAHTFRGHVSGGHIQGSTSADATKGITGYGVTFEDGSRFMQVNEVQFDNCRSFVNGGGVFPASNVDIMWNHGRGASTIGYGAHEPCYYWKFAHNTVTGGGGGIQFRGQHGTVEYNTILDCPGNGIRFYTDEGITGQVDLVSRGNHIEKCGNGLVFDGTAVTSSSVESIKRDVMSDGDKFFDVTFDAILLRNFDTATLRGFEINGTGNNGINASGLSAANPSKNLVIGKGTVKNVALVGIRAKWVNDIDLEVGTIDTAGQQGVLLDTCVGTSTAGGSIRRTSGNGIRIAGGSVHVIRPGTIKELVGATADAVVAVTATDVSVLGGITTGNRYGVYTSGCDRVIVDGVNAEGSVGSAGAKIRIEGATTYKLGANIGVSNPAS